MSGNGFDPASFGLGADVWWEFTSPGYNISNFPHDVAGPIELTIGASYNNGHVPEGGATIGLLFLGLLFALVFLPFCARQWKKRATKARLRLLLNDFMKEHRKVEDLQKQVAALTAGLQKVSAAVELNKPAPTQVANNR